MNNRLIASLIFLLFISLSSVSGAYALEPSWATVSNNRLPVADNTLPAYDINGLNIAVPPGDKDDEDINPGREGKELPVKDGTVLMFTLAGAYFLFAGVRCRKKMKG